MWGMRRLKREHGAEEDGAGEDVGAKEEHRRGDVGAVGVADGDHLAEMTAGASVFDEIGQFLGAADEVVFVEDAGGEAAEEAWLAVFEDLSARAKQRGAGTEEAAEWNEVAFVAAGAVQEEKRGRGAGVEEEVHCKVSSGSVFSIWRVAEKTAAAEDGDATGLKTESLTTENSAAVRLPTWRWRQVPA